MTKIIDWNINQRDGAWCDLVKSGADVALIQEACRPPVEIATQIEVDSSPWATAGLGLRRPWRTAVVKLSDRVEVRWFEQRELHEAARGEFGVSRLGTLAVALITPTSGEPFLVASMYAPWEKQHRSVEGRRIYADASVHRLISDLSVFIGYRDRHRHRIVAAGDLNVLNGYGEKGSRYWASRYATVFDRMDSLGMEFVGPQVPQGRAAEPWPGELPEESKNVPTYHTKSQTPETAKRQLDFVFASQAISSDVTCAANNEPADWGHSDHCMIEIKVG